MHTVTCYRGNESFVFVRRFNCLIRACISIANGIVHFLAIITDKDIVQLAQVSIPKSTAV